MVATRARGSTLDGAHRREVEDDAAVVGAESGDVVTAAADGEGESGLAGVIDDRDDVGDIGGADDDTGAAVDHPVVDAAGVVVAGIGGADDVAVDAGGKAAERGFGQDRRDMGEGGGEHRRSPIWRPRDLRGRLVHLGALAQAIRGLVDRYPMAGRDDGVTITCSFGPLVGRVLRDPDHEHQHRGTRSAGHRGKCGFSSAV